MAREDMREDRQNDYFLIACRLCGRQEYAPKRWYKEEDFIGYECPTCLNKIKFWRGCQ